MLITTDLSVGIRHTDIVATAGVEIDICGTKHGVRTYGTCHYMAEVVQKGVAL